MPRPLATTFADLLGKLTVVRVECSKCGRFARYPLHRLIDRHGGNATIIDWLAGLTADCPRKRSASISDQCHARCPVCRECVTGQLTRLPYCSGMARMGVLPRLLTGNLTLRKL
jgi:hypothetical protein